MGALADTTIRDVTITKDTKIPLYNLLTLLGIAVAGTAWGMRIDNRVGNIEESLRTATNDRWRREDMANFVDVWNARHPNDPMPLVLHGSRD